MPCVDAARHRERRCIVASSAHIRAAKSRRESVKRRERREGGHGEGRSDAFSAGHDGQPYGLFT
jgi:hypothetical protein